MSSSSFLFRKRGNNSRARHGFTLIELLTVMAIIVVLAGLVLGVASHANYKGSLARADAEVRALSAAAERYKIDNGAYPRNSDTDSLDPQHDFDPSQGTQYKKVAEFLYQEISGVRPPVSGQTTLGKSYYNFQPSQIDIATDAPGSTVRSPTSPYMYAIDPFGFAYGYSTAYQKAAEDAATAGSTTIADRGYNPTFDLWSTAGYSTAAGKNLPTSHANLPSPQLYSSLWIKNW